MICFSRICHRVSAMKGFELQHSQEMDKQNQTYFAIKFIHDISGKRSLHRNGVTFDVYISRSIQCKLCSTVQILIDNLASTKLKKISWCAATFQQYVQFGVMISDKYSLYSWARTLKCSLEIIQSRHVNRTTLKFKRKPNYIIYIYLS